MTKIAFLGDIHGKNTNPLNRLCDYNEDQFKKMEWVRDYCMNNNIKTIVHLGDIHDKPEATEAWKNRVIQIWEPYKSFGTFYSIIGVLHDLFSNQESSYPRTCLYNLELSGILKVLREPVLVEDKVCLYPLKMYTKECKTNMDEVNIDICRCPLYFRSDDVKIDWILLAHQFYNWELDLNAGLTDDDLSKLETECSLILGHDHRQYDTVKSGKVSIYRPGSFMRTELSEETIKMKPRMLVYDDGNFEYVEIPHRDINEIYNVQEYRMNKANTKAFRHLENNLNEVSKYIHSDTDVISCSEALKTLKCPPEEFDYLKAVHQLNGQEF